MDKQLKDFLHYYIGHVDYRVKYIDGDSWTVWSKLTPGRYARAVEDHLVEKIEIGVRKLESMTEDEAVTLFDLIGKGPLSISNEAKAHEVREQVCAQSFHTGVTNLSGKDWTKVFHYLLSRGFDLWNLIDAGLAIDKATIK